MFHQCLSTVFLELPLSLTSFFGPLQLISLTSPLSASVQSLNLEWLCLLYFFYLLVNRHKPAEFHFLVKSGPAGSKYSNAGVYLLVRLLLLWHSPSPRRVMIQPVYFERFPIYACQSKRCQIEITYRGVSILGRRKTRGGNKERATCPVLSPQHFF